MNSMFIALCLIVAAVAQDPPAPTAIMCNQGNATNSAACPAPADGGVAATLCSMPKFVEYTGLSAGVDYACGACAEGTKDATCMECTGATNASCNVPQAAGKSFMCYNFAYDAATKVFAQAVNATTCQRLEATEAICNSPEKAAAAEYLSPHAGCGPCVANTTCVECKGDGCNSATTITAFLLPLVALIYTLV
ncbi:uncharacterized protein LOC134814056 [Bolinopsis microptera]|uniref:uncharacterized protein LOC134814056 n=1 Tax=Bolinopsis microptera TaxID=2820187 RepID=UPI00307AACED